jgi:hypothetical protein
MPDPSFILPLLLQSALVPAAAAAILLLLLSAGHRTWPAPLGIAAGLLASYIATYHAQWRFPPHQALDWLPLVLVIALGALAVERQERAGALPSRLLLALLVSGIVAWPALGSAGLPKTLLLIVVAAALITTVWTALAAPASSEKSPAAALVLAAVAGGAGLALMIDASQLLGQLCGALGVSVLVCGLLRRPPQGMARAAVGVATLLLGALLAYAHIYAGFGLLMVLLLTGALLAGALAIRLVSSPRAWLAAVAASGLPVLAALGLAIRAMQESGGY